MRIDGDIPKVSGVYGKDKKIKNIDRASAVRPKKDDISISDTGKDFQTVLNAVRNKSDIRQEKVEEVKKKIESGTYDVDGHEVADKIIQSIINAKI